MHLLLRQRGIRNRDNFIKMGNIQDEEMMTMKEAETPPDVSPTTPPLG